MTTTTIQLWPKGDSVTFSGEWPDYIVDGAPAAPELAKRIRAEELAEWYAGTYIERNQSALVDALIERAFPGFGVDDIENLHPDSSNWDIAAVRDQAEAAEVYEWYLVHPWLCARLREIGEVVIDNDYGHWWGCTCTGQALLMDGTLQKIAERFAEVEL